MLETPTHLTERARESQSDRACSASYSTLPRTDVLTMSGVTRRRQVAGSGTNDNGDGPSRTSTPARANGARDLEQESDHKIAYDPKDLEQGEERAKQPKLTLMEEVLLLGLKDREVRLDAGGYLVKRADMSGLLVVLE